MYVEHNKPNWDKLQAISVLTSDSPKLGPAVKKNPHAKKCSAAKSDENIIEGERNIKAAEKDPSGNCNH